MVFPWRWPRSHLPAQYHGYRRGPHDNGWPAARQDRSHEPRIHPRRSARAASPAPRQSRPQTINGREDHPITTREFPFMMHPNRGMSGSSRDPPLTSTKPSAGGPNLTGAPYLAALSSYVGHSRESANLPTSDNRSE